MADALAALITIRRLLATTFLFGSLGTGFELLLLEHTEGAWQIVPLALIGAGCLALPALMIRPALITLRAFQLMMWLFLLSGVAGVVLHYGGNRAFELELNPDAAGWSLVWESLKGATPSLAPGTMSLLGAIGLSYSVRYAGTGSVQR